MALALSRYISEVIVHRQIVKYVVLFLACLDFGLVSVTYVDLSSWVFGDICVRNVLFGT